MNDVRLTLLTTAASLRYDIDWMLRQYHNFAHALDVLRYAREISGGNIDNSVYIAALYHDAVYLPGAGGDANELCSAAALGIDAVNCGYSINDNDIKLAQHLIRYTSAENHVLPIRINGLYAVIMDADLASVSVPYKSFAEKQLNIIHENGGVGTIENKQRSASFLSQFLHKRDFIYHTDYARNHYETDAKKNIRKWIADNGTI